jgi:Cys-Gly metallodipeptidase DUG1
MVGLAVLTLFALYVPSQLVVLLVSMIQFKSDNYWLNTRTPVVTYGLRGLSYYMITISGPARDLHSGVFGGMVHEPMTDLMAVMSKLVTPDGTILIPGVKDMIAAADEKEM